MKLTAFIADEFRYCMDHALNMASTEEGEDSDLWELTASAFRAVLEGSELTLDQSKALEAEMVDSEDKYEGKSLKEWRIVMAELGFLDIYDPNVISSRAIKTMIHKGIKYIIG